MSSASAEREHPVRGRNKRVLQLLNFLDVIGPNASSHSGFFASHDVVVTLCQTRTLVFVFLY